MKTRLFLALAAIASCLTLTQCQTTEGLGRDLQTLGERIEDKAEEKQSY